MKNDKVIVDIVKSMKKSVDEFVEYVETYNQCAYSDDMICNILKYAEKLKEAYDTNTP